MSIALAIPMPQATSSVGRQWVAVHIAAQLIGLTATGAAYGLAVMIGANDPSAGLMLKKAAVDLGIAMELIYAFAIAGLRGAVLRQVLPAFPMQLWIVAVVGYLMLFALLSGLSDTGAAVRPTPQMMGAVLLPGIAVAMLLGTVIGFMVGAIEALVLRPVAHGAGAWTLWSAIAWAAGMVVVLAVGAAMLMLPGLSATTQLLLGVATKIVVGTVVGALTLPALNKLQPR